ncbi:MAG: YjjG family noncanonical pyrimidine nucleotidase [Candidatus Cyclobacteriaceae bacterium M3_2C_046]
MGAKRLKTNHQYRDIFFDLDHTLWDFDKNSAEVLTELFAHYRLEECCVSLEQFISKFHEINRKLWRLHEQALIDKESIRDSRFRIIFSELNLPESSLPPDIGESYLKLCPVKENVIPYSHQVLDYLKKKQYKLHIITNGFEDVQHLKLKSACLDHYFDQIITAESCGYKKPHASIFQHALQVSGSGLTQSLMIGDNPESDIAGAINFNMDCIYYNPLGTSHNYKVTFEISCLSELMKIL